jgi:predicted AAA+ superfamily ATPase
MILVGPRGVGKSTAVRNALKDRKAVVHMTLTDSENQATSLQQSLGSHLGLQLSDTDAVAAILKKAK